MTTGKGPHPPRPSGLRPPYMRGWREGKMWRVIPVILAILSLLTAGYLSTFTSVKIIDGDRAISLNTHQTTVGAALREAAIPLEPEDVVSPSPEAPLNRNDTIIIQRAKLLNVSIDSQAPHRIRTQSHSALEVLAQLGIAVNAHDLLLVNGMPTSSLPDKSDPTAPSGDPSTGVDITYKHAQEVTVQERDATPITIETTAPTVGEALMEAGYKLYLADEVLPSPGEPVQIGTHITISPSKPVSVWVDGRQVKTRTQGATVADVLADLGIVLYGEDYTRPDLSTPAVDGMAIRVVRVRHDVVVNQEVIPYDTRVEASSNVELDHEILAQEGTPGVHETRQLVTYEDDVETKRDLIADFTAREPEPRIYQYGTNVVIRTLNTPSGPVQYWRVVHMLATSYSASTAGVSLGVPYYGHVRCGFAMRSGIVAVDPRLIPLHTNVYVPDYGLGNACDTGSAIVGKRIDLGYDDNNLQLWYRWVDVYLLTPVPGNIRYNLD